MMEGSIKKSNKDSQGNAFREMMLENIEKKRASGEPFSELEKAFLREEDARKIVALNEDIEERARERRENHAP